MNFPVQTKRRGAELSCSLPWYRNHSATFVLPGAGVQRLASNTANSLLRHLLRRGSRGLCGTSPGRVVTTALPKGCPCATPALGSRRAHHLWRLAELECWGVWLIDTPINSAGITSSLIKSGPVPGATSSALLSIRFLLPIHLSVH